MFENYVPSQKFKVLDKNDDWIGHFEKVISVQWLERWTRPGEFKMEMQLTEYNVKLYQDAYTIVSDDSRTRMVVCHQESDHLRDEPTGTLTIRGFSWIGWLDRRVIRGGTYMLTNVEAAIYLLAQLDPADVIVNGPSSNLPATTTKQVTYGAVMEVITELCEVSGYGVVCENNYPLTKPVVDTLYVERGIDRTQNNLPFYIGTLSDTDGTLSDVSVISGWEDYRNLAQVAGEGEGADRYVIDVFYPVGGERPQGRDLFEMHVDARDLQKTYVDDSGTEHTLSDAEYEELLRQRGLEKLQENIATIEISAVPNSNTFQFNKDYRLGDRLSIKLLTFNNVPMSARAEEVTYIYEAEQIDVSILLSNFEVLESQLEVP